VYLHLKELLKGYCTIKFTQNIELLFIYLQQHIIVANFDLELIYGGSFAKVVQLITAWKFASFLTPDMASKNDARHGGKKRCRTWHRLFSARITRCHLWYHFLTPCLASKTIKLHTRNNLPNFGKRAFIDIAGSFVPMLGE